MTQLKLFLFGRPRLEYEGERVAAPNRKAFALLAYLVGTQENHSRDRLAALFWPEYDQTRARANLRQTLYLLNKTPVGPFIQAAQEQVGLETGDASWVDMLQFQELLREGNGQGGYAALRQAVDLYKGDFLEDFYLPDSNEFEDWAVVLRQQLRQETLDSLETLTNHFVQEGDYKAAQSTAWRQLEIDNLRETAYRGLMTALAQSGQRSAALAQFETLRALLEKELGVEPSAETTALFEQIRAESLPPIQPARSQPTQQASHMPVFLCTDIESSTPLWDRHRQDMLPALQKHNAILEEGIQGCSGRVLELRGDGVMAVFEGGQPLECVLFIQRELGRVDWGPVGEVRVRMGLHGMPVEREGVEYFKQGEMYFGPALNTAARIMDAGWGGQVLVSGALKETLPLPEGAAWQDFGAQGLKGLEDPIHIFGFMHPELPHQGFSTLRITETPAAAGSQVDVARAQRERVVKLPVPATPFIGREEELEQVGDLLENPDVRLLTIFGPGGIGKTRLALAAAERLARSRPFGEGGSQTPPYKDGVYFVPLAPVEDPNLITTPIAEAFNASIHRDDPSFMASPIADVLAMPFYRKGIWEGWTGDWQNNQLVSYLRDKEMLLLLDNFEHLLDGVELLPEILQRAPGVKILVTSRETLRLHGETVFTLAGMQISEEEISSKTSLSDAVHLFVQSAQRAQPQFSPTTVDLVEIVDICRMVEGMPLAIELAAAWISALSLGEIAAEIGRNLDLLETRLRDLPERHQSIRSVFGATWERMSEEERDVFKQLSVFQGGFTRDAAERVAGASLRILMDLVNKSLIRRDAEGRFQIHELLRQFGTEQLKETYTDFVATKDRYSAFYAGFLHRMEPGLKSGDQSEALEKIEKEHENVRSAWNWAVGQGRLDEIDLSMESLCEYYRLRALLSEAWDTFYTASRTLGWGGFRKEKELERSKKTWEAGKKEGYSSDLDPRSELILGKVLARYGRFHCENPLADPSPIQIREDTLPILGKYDARLEIAYLLSFTGHLGHSHSEREALYHEALETFREFDDRWGETFILYLLGESFSARGKYAESNKYCLESLARFKELGDRYGVAKVHNYLGYNAWAIGAYEEANRHLLEGLDLFREMDTQTGVAMATRHLGLVAAGLGELQKARQRYQDSLELFKELGLHGWLAVVTADLSYLHTELGEYTEALSLARESLAVSKEVNFAEGISWASTALGIAALGSGDLGEAERYLYFALAADYEFRAMPVSDKIHSLAAMAELLAVKGENRRALELGTFVLQHPASWQWTRDQAGKVMAELEGGLSSEEAPEIRQLYGENSLEVVVEELLEARSRGD